MNTIALMFGWVAVLSAVILYLTPIPVFRTIMAHKDVLQYSSTVYFVSCLQCSLWLVYSIITPDREQTTLSATFGTTVNFIYIVLFFVYSKRPNTRVRLCMRLAVMLGTFCAIVGTTMFASPHIKALQGLEASPETTFLGAIAVIVNVVMFGSPLSVLRTVVSSKSSRFMPLPITLGTLFCSVAWLMYAFLIHDMNLLLPNVFGVVLGMLQVILWVRYRDPRLTSNKKESSQATAKATCDTTPADTNAHDQENQIELVARTSAEDDPASIKWAHDSASSLTSLL